MIIDLAFTALGTAPIAADHAYHLYAALSRQLPALHQANGIAVHPIRGRIVGPRQMALTPESRVTLRADSDRIGELLSLSGRELRLGDDRLRLGVPEVRQLIPATALRSRLVVIKLADAADDLAALTPETFLAAAGKQLSAMGISAAAELGIPPDAKGRPHRRTLRIKQREVVGYELIVTNLTAEESIRLQEAGLGGKRHMGCGVFVPLR